jgi:hypothetical protein
MAGSLEKVTNNLQIALQLHKMIASGRLVHAFLFCGGSAESRKELASAFAEDLLEGDIIDYICVSKPEDKQTIVVDQIEELLAKLKYKPYGKRYVVVIEDAHLMRPEAQNKFLKSLEEPVSETVYILLSERQSAMLPTIVSRCNSYFLEDAEPSADPLIEAAADELFKLTLQGAPYYKKKAALAPVLNLKEDQRELAVSLLEIYSERLRRGLSREKGDFTSNSSKRMLRALETAQRALRSLKEMASPAYTLKSLCLII